MAIKPIFHQKTRLHLLPNANKKGDKQHESDMPNANMHNYFPPARVGVCIGSVGIRVGTTKDFGYQDATRNVLNNVTPQRG